jgi:hypothetical protein
MNGEKMNPYRILVGNPKGKRLNRKTKRRWVDNINIQMELTRDRMRWYGLD